MDGTASIGSTFFRLGQKYVKRLLRKISIGMNSTHVGVLQYGSAENIVYSSRLETDNVRSTVSHQISGMVYQSERRDSDLAHALTIANDVVSIYVR